MSTPRSEQPDARERSRTPRWRRYLSWGLSLVVVVGVFVFAIPQFADYAAVWDTMRSLTPIELATLVAATVFNLVTYWLANMAALPGLTLGRAAIVTQTTTAVANSLPAGGAIAVGLTYQIQRSWGFSSTEIALYVAVTGLWNIFAKLALPIVSVVVLVIVGQSGGTYVVAAAIGVGVLGVAAGVLAAIFWKEELARRIGARGGAILTWLRGLVKKPPVTDLGERAVRFRADTVGLVRSRWVFLSLATVGSHLALFLVLLLALRHVGVSEADVSTAEALAVYAFGRLISALPVTPGGLGVIELGYIGGLRAAAGSELAPQVVAAVLLFRVLTFGIQIPIGGLTYLAWRSTTRAARSPGERASDPDTR